MRYFLEGFPDEGFELVFVLNNDRCHRPFEVVPDLFDWIQVARTTGKTRIYALPCLRQSDPRLRVGRTR